MSAYGELLDGDGENIGVYNFFIEYFENPRMSLVRETDDGNLIYSSRIKNLLTRQKKYLFAVIKKKSQPQDVVRLSDLNWIIFQTRVFDEDKPVSLHSYTVKQDKENIIHLEKRTDENYTYRCESFPVKVMLISPKTQVKPYSEKGTLGLALETYNCVVYMN